MSSHREAPAISKDPVADNTDLYAFVSQDAPTKVTIISNFVPLEEPAGGPNFHQFGDDVLYEILIDNNGDAMEDITYQFRFRTVQNNPDTFLYNTGPITASDGFAGWNVRQFYSVTKILGPRRTGKATLLATDVPSPPVRIGPRSTPGYPALAADPLFSPTLPSGERVFAGQRAEGFYVDLGSIFDLGTLRPFQGLHGIPATGTVFGSTDGKNDTKGYNVHSIAIQVPKTMLTRDGSVPTDPLDAKSVIGIWSTASRRKATVREKDGRLVQTGPWVQVSRLGMPLINEVVIELGEKDFWNSASPVDDVQFLDDYTRPELQTLLPILYPGLVLGVPAFATLAATFPPPPAAAPPRDDLVAILLTGIPPGIISGFQNVTGSTKADLLRLNMAIGPSYSNPNAAAGTPSQFGLLRVFADGTPELDGFPNGRRVFDNVTAIELRAIAGLTYQLVASYTPDPAAGLLLDGTTNDPAAPYLSTFPYLAVPYEGYAHEHDP